MINATLICVSFNFVCGIILIQSYYYCVILQIKVKNVCKSMKFILRRYLYQYRKYSTFKIVGFKIFLQGYMANFKMRKGPSHAHDGSLMSTALCRANRVHVVLIMASVISVPELLVQGQLSRIRHLMLILVTQWF